LLLKGPTLASIKHTPVRQLLDCQAYEEFIDSQDWTRGEVKLFEMSRRKLDLTQPIYVGVVSTTRHYGGPEEGGWWYDWTQVEEILETVSFRSLLWWVRELRNNWPTCSRGRGSVIGGADVTIYMARDKRLIERLQSTEIPRYE
jgi:hypothetical protein